MSILVVDASVAANWFFEEQETASARRVLDERHRLHAPDLMLLEIDSVLTRRIRRGQIIAGQGDDIRAALRQIPIQMHSFLPLLDPAYAMAGQTGRSVYDALYVALAELLDGRVVTADRRLYEGLAGGPWAQRVVWVGEAEV